MVLNAVALGEEDLIISYLEDTLSGRGLLVFTDLGDSAHS